MTNRQDFLNALSAAPVRPLTDDNALPGMPGGEWCLPALWAITDRTERRAGPEVMERIRASTADFLAGGDDDGTWRD